MPKYKHARCYQLGEWWLAQRQPGNVWYRCRFDPPTRKTARLSLYTADYEKAVEAFNDWWRESFRPWHATGSEVTLARILSAYYQDHASRLRSARAAALHINLWLDFWQDTTLADVADRDRQQQFRAWLGENHSAAYVQRILTTGKAAINRAEKVGLIGEREGVRIVDIDKRDMAGAEAKGRPLEPAEIAALIDAIGPRGNNLYRMILLLLATYARPDALYDLTDRQLDFKRRTIDLNPPGRRQNNKYRPVVKMPSFIASYFAGVAGNVHPVNMKSQRVIDLKRSRIPAVQRAGLDGKVTFYSFRHTGARWLRHQGVQPWEVSTQLGHQAREALTLERHYAPAAPDYLSNALAAVELLFLEVRRHSQRLQADFKAARVSRAA